MKNKIIKNPKPQNPKTPKPHKYEKIDPQYYLFNL